MNNVTTLTDSQLSSIDFRTERQKHADEIVETFRKLRSVAPALTSDNRVCVLAAQSLGMHPQGVLYHVKRAGLLQTKRGKKTD